MNIFTVDNLKSGIFILSHLGGSEIMMAASEKQATGMGLLVYPVSYFFGRLISKIIINCSRFVKGWSDKMSPTDRICIKVMFAVFAGIVPAWFAIKSFTNSLSLKDVAASYFVGVVSCFCMYLIVLVVESSQLRICLLRIRRNQQIQENELKLALDSLPTIPEESVEDESELAELENIKSNEVTFHMPIANRVGCISKGPGLKA